MNALRYIFYINLTYITYGTKYIYGKVFITFSNMLNKKLTFLFGIFFPILHFPIFGFKNANLVFFLIKKTLNFGGV